jgi:hypothetical protein
MRKFLVWMVAGGAALAAGAPALAERNAAPPPRAYHRTSLEIALGARLQSIQMRIELLREEGLMGSEQARDLGRQSRILEERLIGLSARDATDVEFGISRLQDRVRVASDDARWGRHVFARDEQDRFDDHHAYEMQRPNAFEQMDRHIAPPVDRWDDPFDRGDEL